MPASRDDLAGLASAIVLGGNVPPRIVPGYANYLAAVALDVYRNNYRGNLHNALASAYPVTEQLVGQPFFRRMTREYITRHPSRNGNLHNYGGSMSDFIASFEPAQELAYLPDMAALEWACHRAYFADNAGELNLAGLALLPQERYADLVLYLQPACSLLRSRFPAAAIWQAHQPVSPEDFHIDLASGPCNALVSRSMNVVRVSELNDADAEWLQAIQAGKTLGVATAATKERHPGFDLQAALLHLVAQGALSDFRLEIKQ